MPGDGRRRDAMDGRGETTYVCIPRELVRSGPEKVFMEGIGRYLCPALGQYRQRKKIVIVECSHYFDIIHCFILWQR